MSLTHAQAVRRIDRIFSKFGTAGSLVGGKWTAGKVYEAWVLSAVLLHLEKDEGFDVKLVGEARFISSRLQARSIRRTHGFG